MTVRDAQRRIDSREFSEWMAFSQIDPFGEWRADARAGIIASTVANAHSTRGKAFTAADFMMEFDKQPKPTQTVAQQKSVFRTWAASTTDRKKR